MHHGYRLRYQISTNTCYTADNSNLFYGYSDAAYGNNDDLKSTSTYVYIVAGELLLGNRKSKLLSHYLPQKQSMSHSQKPDERLVGYRTYMAN
jgi:hypothetical protein